MKEYGKAFRIAFPYTIPVLAGYLFIGIAFGVMFQEKGYNFLWAALMSLLVYAGSGQYLAVNFFVPGFSFIQMIVLTLMVNIRHVFYGLSMLDRFKKIGKKRWYMIFALTDETYSLLCMTKTPEGVESGKFMFAICLLDQSYWIAGSVIGAIAGHLIPFNSEGIEFAMTSLFIVLFVESWLSNKDHKPAFIGIGASVISLLIFWPDKFILPAMIIMMVLLLAFRGAIRTEVEAGAGGDSSCH